MPTEKPSQSFKSVHADRAHTDSRNADVVIHHDDSGTLVVDGPNGDISYTGDILDAIEAANDGAPADGWHIHVAAGYYEYTGTWSDGELCVITKPIKLSGAGWATHIRAADNTAADNEGIRAISVQADGVTFESFRKDGNQQNNNGETGGADANTITNDTDGHNIRVGTNNATGGSDFTMRGVYSVNSTGDGVEPTQGARVTIENCVFRDNWEQCVHFNGCSEATLNGCILDGEVNNAIINTFTTTGAVTEHITIGNCVLMNGQQEGIKIDPGNGSVRDIHIGDDVFILDCAQEGVLVTGDSASYDNPPEDITVNATIKRCLHGFRVGAGSKIQFSGEAARNDERGVYVDPLEAISDIRVEDSRVANNGVATEQEGILVRNRSYAVSQLRVTDNDVLLTDTDAAMDVGIKFVSDTGSYDKCLVYNNHSDGARVYDTQGYGNVGRFKGTATITASGSAYVTVTHNLGKAPDPDRIQVTPLGSMNGGGVPYVPDGNISSTTFRIQCDALPSADVRLNWWIRPEG